MYVVIGVAWCLRIAGCVVYKVVEILWGLSRVLRLEFVCSLVLACFVCVQYVVYGLIIYILSRRTPPLWCSPLVRSCSHTWSFGITGPRCYIAALPIGCPLISSFISSCIKRFRHVAFPARQILFSTFTITVHTQRSVCVPALSRTVRLRASYSARIFEHFYLKIAQPIRKGEAEKKLRGFGRERTIQTDQPSLVGDVVPTFADRGCRVVSAADSDGR
jgi:hypothetical protein